MASDSDQIGCVKFQIIYIIFPNIPATKYEIKKMDDGKYKT